MKKQNTNNNIYYANGQYYTEKPKPVKVKMSRKKKRIILTVIIVVLAVYAFHICEKMWANELCQAMYSNKTAKAEKLIKMSVFDVNTRNGMAFPFNWLPELSGDTIIGVACETGNIEIAEKLIAKGANLNQCGGERDFSLAYNTVLEYHDNDLEMLKLLIRHGAPLQEGNDSFEGNILSNIAYMDCDDYKKSEMEESDFEEIEYMKRGYDKEKAEKIVEIYKFVKTKMKDPTYTENAYGETVLMDAALMQNIELMKYLMDNEKIDINAKDEYGQTCLFFVLPDEMAYNKKWKTDTVELLISRGADPDIKDSEGMTAYDYAVEGGDEYLAELLKKYMSSNN